MVELVWVGYNEGALDVPMQINCAGFWRRLRGRRCGFGGLNFAPGQLCTRPACHTKFQSIDLVSQFLGWVSLEKYRRVQVDRVELKSSQQNPMANQRQKVWRVAGCEHHLERSRLGEFRGGKKSHFMHGCVRSYFRGIMTYLTNFPPHRIMI